MRVRNLAGLLVVSAAPLLTGCAGMSKTAQGAGIGGAIGAGTGALIGSASGNAGKGALIGTGAGAILGGLMGNEEDQRDKRAMEDRVHDAEARNPANQPMGVDDVIRMAQEKQSDRIIINQIRTTNSSFNLTTEDLSRLSAGGVSSVVVEEMQNRRPGSTVRHVHVAPPPTRVIYTQPPPPPDVIFVSPPPPPPPGFGVGVHIRR